MINRTFFSRTTMTVVMTSMLAAADLRAEPTPTLPAEVKKTVDAFAGRWTLDGTISMPGEGPKKATLKMDCKKTAMGKGVACSMSGPFDASILVGYDRYGKAVHFMAVTSDDEVHDHKCHWQGDQKLVCDPLKGGMGEVAITEDLEFTVGAKKVGFTSVIVMPDGGKASCAFMSK
jgi:hypothetical protein